MVLKTHIDRSAVIFGKTNAMTEMLKYRVKFYQVTSFSDNQIFRSL